MTLLSQFDPKKHSTKGSQASSKTWREHLPEASIFYATGFASGPTSERRDFLEAAAVTFDKDDLDLMKKSNMQVARKIDGWASLMMCVRGLIAERFPTDSEMSKLVMVITAYANCSKGASMSMTLTTPQHSLGGKTWVRAMAELLVGAGIGPGWSPESWEKNVRATSLWILGKRGPLGNAQQHSIMSSQQEDDFNHSEEDCRRQCNGRCGIPTEDLGPMIANHSRHHLIPLQESLQSESIGDVILAQRTGVFARGHAPWPVSRTKIMTLWKILTGADHTYECCCSVLGAGMCLQTVYLQAKAREAEHCEHAIEQGVDMGQVSEYWENRMNIMGVWNPDALAAHVADSSKLVRIAAPAKKSAKAAAKMKNLNDTGDAVKAPSLQPPPPTRDIDGRPGAGTKAPGMQTKESSQDATTQPIGNKSSTGGDEARLLAPTLVAPLKSVEQDPMTVVVQQGANGEEAPTLAARAQHPVVPQELTLVLDDSKFPVVEQRKVTARLMESTMKEAIVNSALSDLWTHEDNGQEWKAEHHASSGLRKLTSAVYQEIVVSLVEQHRQAGKTTKQAMPQIKIKVCSRVSSHIIETLDASIKARTDANPPSLYAPIGHSTWGIRAMVAGRVVDMIVCEANVSRRIGKHRYATFNVGDYVVLRSMSDKALNCRVGVVVGETDTQDIDEAAEEPFQYIIELTQESGADTSVRCHIAPRQLLKVDSGAKNSVIQSAQRVTGGFQSAGGLVAAVTADTRQVATLRSQLSRAEQELEQARQQLQPHRDRSSVESSIQSQNGTDTMSRGALPAPVVETDRGEATEPVTLDDVDNNDRRERSPATGSGLIAALAEAHEQRQTLHATLPAGGPTPMATSNQAQPSTPSVSNLEPVQVQAPVAVVLGHLEGIVGVNTMIESMLQTKKAPTMMQRAMVLKLMEGDVMAGAVSHAKHEYREYARKHDADYNTHETEGVCFACGDRLVTGPKAMREDGEEPVWRHLYQAVAADGSRMKLKKMEGDAGVACNDFVACTECVEATQSLALKMEPHSYETCILKEKMFMTIIRAYSEIEEKRRSKRAEKDNDRERTPSGASRKQPSRSDGRKEGDRRSRGHSPGADSRNRKSRSRSRDRSRARDHNQSCASEHSPQKRARSRSPEPVKKVKLEKLERRR